MMHILNLAESVAPRFVKDYRRVVFLGVCLGTLDLHILARQNFVEPGLVDLVQSW